jgi:hypothetical protein
MIFCSVTVGRCWGLFGYEPFVGTVISCGRISPLFDIGLGIDHQIRGYDNIRLRGMILGLTASEIEDRMPDIVEFTELGGYLDLPVRTYSSGMMTRLTFAVATCFSPEILLMDEWITAGDAGFLTRAQHRVQSFRTCEHPGACLSPAASGAPRRSRWSAVRSKCRAISRPFWQLIRVMSARCDERRASTSW